MKSIYQKWNEDKVWTTCNKTGHAKYSPSKFNQYVHCPYSAKFEKIKGDTSAPSEDAQLGTIAHDIAATKLIYGKNSQQVADKLKQYSEYDLDVKLEKLNRDADDYVDFVISQIGDYSCVRVEEILDMDGWISEVYGTADCVIVDPNVLTVIDYKYGMKPVEAENNAQLIAYAVGAMCAMHFAARPEMIQLVIYQPRAMGQTVKVWSIDYVTLMAKATAIKKQIEKIDKATLSDRHAGPHCQYCGNRICPCKLEWIAEMLQVDTAKEFLNDSELFGLQTIKRTVMRLLQNFEDDVVQLYEDGEVLQDYKLQYTGGRKSWTDETKVKEILTGQGLDDVYELPSPAQLKSKVSRDVWDKLGFDAYVEQNMRKNGFVAR